MRQGRADLELMQGAIDLHIHSAPSLFPRLVDHVEAAEGARKYGMRAVVLKEHHGYTADRMYFVRKLINGIEVYGGVVLNNAVGGINPFAVDAAIKLGPKSSGSQPCRPRTIWTKWVPRSSASLCNKNQSIN